MENFWSRALLGTNRYHGTPYQVHTGLPLKIEDFDIWLDYFRQTAQEVLPALVAEHAVAKAELMAESFKLGMFFHYAG